MSKIICYTPHCRLLQDAEQAIMEANLAENEYQANEYLMDDYMHKIQEANQRAVELER